MSLLLMLAVSAAEPCTLEAEKGVQDTDTLVELRCKATTRVAGERAQVTVGDETFDVVLDQSLRETFRVRLPKEARPSGRLSFRTSHGDTDRLRRGTCKFEDYEINKEFYSVTASSDTSGTCVVSHVITADGDVDFTVRLRDHDVSIDEEPILDFEVVEEDGSETAYTGSLRRSRAGSHLAFDDSQLFLDVVEADVVFRDETLAVKAELTPVDGEISFDLTIDADGVLDFDAKGRADADQDVAKFSVAVTDGDGITSTELSAELSTVLRYEMGSGVEEDPAGGEWLLTTTAYQQDSDEVCEVFELDLLAVEQEDGGISLEGGNLRKDGYKVRTRRKKRFSWLEWDGTEMVGRMATIPGCASPELVHEVETLAGPDLNMTTGRSWQVLDGSAETKRPELLEAVAGAKEPVLEMTVRVFDADGKELRETETLKVVPNKADDGSWSVSVPYSWPND